MAMSPQRPKLALKPRLCDGCGRCLEQCRQRAIRVGTGYIYVDWDRCDACGKCAAWCDRNAILERGTPAALEAAPAGGLAYGAGAELPRTSVAGSGRGLLGRMRSVFGRRRAGHAGVGDAVEAWASDEEPVTWSMGEAVVVLAALAVLTAGMEWALSSDLMRSLASGGIALARGVVKGLYYALQVALLLALAIRRDSGFGRAYRLDAAPDALALPVGAGMLLATWVFSLLYTSVVTAAGWARPAADAFSLNRMFGTDALGMSLTAVVVVVVGPAIEEMLLRGVVLGALQERLGTWWGIASSAVLFAALHGSLWGFLPLVAFGLALGRIATGRRSLWPAILLHVSYNALVVALGMLTVG